MPDPRSEPDLLGQELLIAIGNELRGDDGLGWAFAHALGRQSACELTPCFRHQLQAEDAALVHQTRRVVFVDATEERLPDGFDFCALAPDPRFEFTSHSLSPGAVLYLSEYLYGAYPTSHLLKISGQNWDLGESLSKPAQGNLKKALAACRSGLLKNQ